MKTTRRSFFRFTASLVAAATLPRFLLAQAPEKEVPRIVDYLDVHRPPADSLILYRRRGTTLWHVAFAVQGQVEAIRINDLEPGVEYDVGIGQYAGENLEVTLL